MTTAARVAIALAAAWSAIAAAPQVFRGGTDLVLLSVSVLDGAGHPVPNLTRDDFTVMEDGLAQEISVFERDPQPIAMSLLLDTSASMDTKLPVAQEAATGLIRRLGPRDVAQVIDFDSTGRRLGQLHARPDGARGRRSDQTRAGRLDVALRRAVHRALTELEARARRVERRDPAPGRSSCSPTARTRRASRATTTCSTLSKRRPSPSTPSALRSRRR